MKTVSKRMWERMFTTEILGVSMIFQSTPELFSSDKIDTGTAAMLSCVKVRPDDKVLDLGCGYGVVGIYIAKHIGSERVTMCDIDSLALELAEKNAFLNQVPGIRIIKSDGFFQMEETGFSLILSNPPYHTDFRVAKHFIEKGFNRLIVGGKMMMVTKRKEWYKNKLISIFGGVQIYEIDGYFVFVSQKRQNTFASKKIK